MDIETLLSRLDAVKPAGPKKWMARCPAHDDSKASLSVAVGENGGILLHDFGGCDTADVLAKLNLDMADLMPTNGNGNGKLGELVVAYDYTDEKGTLLYQNCRFARKEFRARRPDGNGGWIGSVKDCRRVLYGLPDLLVAKAAGEPILLVEGEKDVHTACCLGIAATTAPFGASQPWLPEFSESLRDADVIVIPDNDAVGREHMAKAAAAVQGIAKSVMWLELPDLPDKGDLSDWVAAGGTADELARLVADARRDGKTPAATFTDAPAVFVDWPAFWARDYSEAEWVYPDVLARGRGHAVYATHKTGKSLLMLFIATQLATGNEPVVAVYLDYEMSESDVFDRLQDMGYSRETDFSRLRYALLPTLPPLDTAAGAESLTALVDGVQSEWPEHHLVVIIDTISRAVSGEENKADTFRDFYAHTGIELKRRGITWVRLDHGGKDASKGQRGSSGKGDDVDVVWRLTATQSGVCLYRDVARMPWVPEKVVLNMLEEPLRYVAVVTDWPAGTNDTANALDRLDVPLDATIRVATAVLTAAGQGRRRQVVGAALRLRRQHLGEAS